MLLTKNKTKTLTGSKIILETLKKLGVNSIFGYPGGIVLSVYDELFKQTDIKHYLVRHEQAAVHAAEGYARVSGKCGVALVTSGPGATNIVTGIANAYLDGYPLVVITGQVSSELIGKDSFQEIDIIDITKTCTKKNFQVRNIEELENTLVEAFHTAMSYKQGPVVVDIAKNVFTAKFDFDRFIEYKIDKPEILENDITKALREICNAKRPVIVIGGGVVQADAHREITEFAKLLNIPVVNTMMGIGTYPKDDENYFGMVGLFGDVSANEVLQDSDLIFAVGARFNDRIRCCFKNNELERHLIHLDVQSSEISRVLKTKTALIGDAKYVLTEMLDDYKSGKYSYNKLIRNEWLKEIKGFRLNNVTPKKRSDKLHSFEVVKTISDILASENPIVTTEVGQHQVWVARGFKFNLPRKFLTSGGSGTMGFGFPAAMGACVANDFKEVYCFAGDGSFQMNIQELATCVDYNLPIKIFIMNNGYLGMVRQFQEKTCDCRYSETKISNPDYLKLAKSYGANCFRVKTLDELEFAVIKSKKINGTVLIDIVIEPDELL